MLPKVLDAASVPAPTINWCGDQTVSLQEWCTYIGTLIGREPSFAESATALRGGPTDVARMHELVGGTTSTGMTASGAWSPRSTPNWSAPSSR